MLKTSCENNIALPLVSQSALLKQTAESAVCFSKCRAAGAWNELLHSKHEKE